MNPKGDGEGISGSLPPAEQQVGKLMVYFVLRPEFCPATTTGQVLNDLLSEMRF